jgi:hypothetical protein
MLSSYQVCKFVLSALTLISLFVPATARAQSDAQRARMWFDREHGAVVKLEVTGTTPAGTTDSREGSGFFIYSGVGLSYVITAAHVIGSNETVQSRNPDWQVENGVVHREIKVRPLNEHGALEDGITEVYPSPLMLQGDIALLSMNTYGYPTLPFSMEPDAGSLRSIMLMGFRAQAKSLSNPSPGTGRLAASWKYVTSIQSWPGESGGPVIDLETGKVVAVVGGSTFQSGPTNEATPISLSLGSLAVILPAANDDQARRAEEEEKYKAASGNLEKLRAYVSSCRICEFKKDAQEEIASLEERERQAAQRDQETSQYRAARGNLEKLRAYVSSCRICEFKKDAQEEIASLEERERRAAQRDQETSQYRAARGNLDKLKVYVASCSICEFRNDATTEIASLERQQPAGPSCRAEQMTDWLDRHGVLDNAQPFDASIYDSEIIWIVNGKPFRKMQWEVAQEEEQDRKVYPAQRYSLISSSAAKNGDQCVLTQQLDSIRKKNGGGEERHTVKVVFVIRTGASGPRIVEQRIEVPPSRP